MYLLCTWAYESRNYCLNLQSIKPITKTIYLTTTETTFDLLQPTCQPANLFTYQLVNLSTIVIE